MKTLNGGRYALASKGVRVPGRFLVMAQAVVIVGAFSACDSGANDNEVVNQRPEVISVTASPNPVRVGGTVTLSGSARSQNGWPLYYHWECKAGSGSWVGQFTDGATDRTAHWVAPEQPMYAVCTFTASTGGGLFGGGQHNAASVGVQVTAGK
jgi:hypothetical protein